MSKLSSYQDNYRNIKLSRSDDGVLEVIFHTDGGPLVWTHIGGAHDEFTDAFGQIARDPDNKVVVMSGSGERFSGPPASPSTSPTGGAKAWEHLRFDAIEMIQRLIEIPVPVISCLNGPAYRHAEIPFLADVVLAADDALIQDTAHFVNGLVPGDGHNLVFPLLLGWNRGRYFLLTGEQIHADRLLELGLVSEVMPRAQLLRRARELARQFAERDIATLRYTRAVLTEPLKDMIDRYLPYSVALETSAGLQVEVERAGTS